MAGGVVALGVLSLLRWWNLEGVRLALPALQVATGLWILVRLLGGRLTGVGYYTLGFIALLYVMATEVAGAAFPQQKNYSLALLALLGGMLLASPILARLNLSRLTVTRSIGGAVFAGSPFSVHLQLKNRSRSLPRFAVSLTDDLPTPIREGARQLYVLGIPPRKAISLTYEGVVPNRGEVVVPGTTARSRFPFGMVQVARFLVCESRFPVYPALGQIRRPLPIEAGPYLLTSGISELRRDANDEVCGVREYREGDQWRHIAWKVSARQQQLVVREYEREEFAPVLIVLDTRLRDLSRGGRQRAEGAVSLAASLANRGAADGRPVALATALPQPLLIPTGLGRTHLQQVLTALAALRFVKNQPGLDDLLPLVSRPAYRRMQVLLVLQYAEQLYDLSAWKEAFPQIAILGMGDPALSEWFRLPSLQERTEAIRQEAWG